jgi:hypothetical protein
LKMMGWIFINVHVCISFAPCETGTMEVQLSPGNPAALSDDGLRSVVLRPTLSSWFAPFRSYMVSSAETKVIHFRRLQPWLQNKCSCL